MDFSMGVTQNPQGEEVSLVTSLDKYQDLSVEKGALRIATPLCQQELSDIIMFIRDHNLIGDAMTTLTDDSQRGLQRVDVGYRFCVDTAISREHGYYVDVHKEGGQPRYNGKIGIVTSAVPGHEVYSFQVFLIGMSLFGYPR